MSLATAPENTVKTGPIIKPLDSPADEVGGKHHIVWSFDNLFNVYDTDWPNPPRIDDIRTVLQPFLDKLELGKSPEIKFLGSGSYHQVFKVCRVDNLNDRQQIENDGPETPVCSSFVFRASLPACPFYKTASEVATMSYVRQHTSIPIPRVYAYDTSSDNAVEHEWILMEMVENASPFIDVEEDMSWEQKFQLSRKVADWYHQLSKLTFNSIGSLYFEDDLPVQRQSSANDGGVTFLATAKTPRSGPVLVDSLGPPIYCLGPAVSNAFNSDWRTEYDFNRGPYPSVSAFIDAVLHMNRLEVSDDRQRARSEMFEAIDNALGNGYMEDKAIRQERFARTEAEWRVKTEARIGGPLDPRINWTVCPPYLVNSHRDYDLFRDSTEVAAHLKRVLEAPEFNLIRQDLTANPSSCQLFAWDMSCNNVLVDSTTKEAVAVIDWEQVVFMPPFLVDFYPRVLLGPGADCENDDFSEPSREGWPEEKYKERLGDYEARLIRDEFRDCLFSLDPTALDRYESRWSEFRPADEESESESEEEPACPDDCPSTIVPSKSRTSLPLDLWSVASPGKHTERRVDHIEAATARPQSHPSALESVPGTEPQTLERERAVEEAIRKTIRSLWGPIYQAWGRVEDLYEALGYKAPEEA
jgi:hypothetical protein